MRKDRGASAMFTASSPSPSTPTPQDKVAYAGLKLCITMWPGSSQIYDYIGLCSQDQGVPLCLVTTAGHLSLVVGI